MTPSLEIREGGFDFFIEVKDGRVNRKSMVIPTSLETYTPQSEKIEHKKRKPNWFPFHLYRFRD